ncbi:separin protein [Massospora cicadina]|nr:separin protein [Massospora cicadina]
MREVLLSKLEHLEQLGPEFTSLVITAFQEVIDLDTLNVQPTGTQLNPGRRKVPPVNPGSKVKFGVKLTQAKKKLAPKVHNQAVDLLLGVTRLLARRVDTGPPPPNLSEAGLDCLVDVGRLCLLTLYHLEPILAPPALSLDQLASNFVTQLIQIRRFGEAKAELRVTHSRIQQHLNNSTPCPKRYRATAEASDEEPEVVDMGELNAVGFGFEGLPPPHPKDRTLHRLVLTVQANLLRAYAETGEVELLKVIAEASGGPFGGPLATLRQLAGEAGFNFPTLFCHYYSYAANRLAHSAGDEPLALKLHLCSLASLTLSNQFTVANGLEMCYKIAFRHERADAVRGMDLVDFYHAGFELVVKPGGRLGEITLDLCSPLAHYLKVSAVQDLRNFNAALDRVAAVFDAIAQPLSPLEAALGRWTLVACAAGVFLTVSKVPAKGAKLEQAFGAATLELRERLTCLADPIPFVEKLSQGFKVFNRAWSQLSLPKDSPLPKALLEPLLSGVAALLGWICTSPLNAASERWMHLVGLTCELLSATRVPLLAHNPVAFWGMFEGFGEQVYEVGFTRGWEVLSSLASNCGGLVTLRADYALAVKFFALSAKLLERAASQGTREHDSLRRQLSSRYLNLGKVQWANGDLHAANLSMVSGIRYAQNVEVGVPLSPDEIATDNESERLKAVELYANWNLAAASKEPTDYPPLSLQALLLSGLALAAVTERELHHLQLRPLPCTVAVRLRLVDQLLGIYKPALLHPLPHARALLTKADILLEKLTFERVLSDEPSPDARVDLRRVAFEALQLLTRPSAPPIAGGARLWHQLTSRAHLLLGTIAHALDDDPQDHLSQAIHHLGLAYSEFSPPTADLPSKPGLPLAEVGFQLSLRLQGLLALRADPAGRAALCQVQLAICGARPFPNCLADVVEVYLTLAQLFQSGGDIPSAERILTLVKGLVDKPPAKVALGCLWRLSYAKFFLDKGEVANGESILKRLAARSEELVRVEGGQRLLALASQVHSQFLLVRGDLDSALEASTQLHRLNVRAAFTALLHRGVARAELAGLDNLALLGRIGHSQDYQRVADLLAGLGSFGQLYMHRGSPKEAELMFQHGLHLAQHAHAVNYANEFYVRLADLQCRRHRWSESQGLASGVLVKTSPGAQDGGMGSSALESCAAAIQCQGDVSMGQGAFHRALEHYERAARLLSVSLSDSDQLPIFSPSSARRFSLWRLQARMVCELGWSKGKTNRLDEAAALLDLLEDVPLPRVERHVYHLVVAKVAILGALDLAKADEHFGPLLNSVWSLPRATRPNPVGAPVGSSVSGKFIGKHLSKAAKHLQLALEDATRFGLVKDLAEVCTHLGMLAFLVPRLSFPTPHLPTAGLSDFAARHLEIYKAISYRRELRGLLPPKLGVAPPANGAWPRLGLQPPPRAPPYWSHVYHSCAGEDPSELINAVLDLLPEPWAVCSVSFNPETEDLYFARFQAAQKEPVLLRLPTRRQWGDGDELDDLSFSQALAELRKIIDTSTEVTKRGAECTSPEMRKAWWATRGELDLKLEELLAFIETAWLGGLKGVLAVDEHPVAPHQVTRLGGALAELLRRFIPELKGVAFELDETVLQVALRAGVMKRAEVEDLVLFLLDSLDYNAPDALDPLVDAACSLLTELAGPAPTGSTFEDAAHLVLILDKHTHFFPWECLPMLLGRSVSRLPSLHFLRNILVGQRLAPTRLFGGGGHVVDEDSAYYVLNPDKDLVSTQLTFQDRFIKYTPWEGRIGSPPDPDQLETALANKDLYIYVGHGSGAKYLRNRRIKSLERCSVALLLGCSSGALRPDGDFDPSGDVVSYLMAGSPAILANLWDVTDKDLDRFTLSLFEGWGLRAFAPKGDASVAHASLTQAVARARASCVLRYLVGAAPIVYGIPCYLRR